jgi:peptidoglycan glycosyltransferase
MDRWSLTAPISLEVPSVASDWSARSITSTSALRAEAIGQGQLTVTPLHVALMAAALANDGSMPAPHLVLGHQSSEGDWTPVRGPQPATAIVHASVARELLSTWSHPDEDVWAREGIAVAGEERPPHAWFAGVSATADGARYAVAVLIEHSSQPATASEIGLGLLRAASMR